MQKKSITQIADELNVSAGQLTTKIHTFGVPIRRRKTTEEKENYILDVKSITEQNWRAHKDKILDRSEYKVRNNDFHLDHIFSKNDGYDYGIPPEVIGHWTNLRIIPGSENSRKRANSHKTIDELWHDYYDSIIIRIDVNDFSGFDIDLTLDIFENVQINLF